MTISADPKDVKEREVYPYDGFPSLSPRKGHLKHISVSEVDLVRLIVNRAERIVKACNSHSAARRDGHQETVVQPTCESNNIKGGPSDPMRHVDFDAERTVRHEIGPSVAKLR